MDRGRDAPGDAPGDALGPELHSFPSSDRIFARRLRTIVAVVRPVSPEELQRTLRPRFPRVVVQRRILSGEPRTIWYVFRDGKVRSA